MAYRGQDRHRCVVGCWRAFSPRYFRIKGWLRMSAAGKESPSRERGAWGGGAARRFLTREQTRSFTTGRKTLTQMDSTICPWSLFPTAPTERRGGRLGGTNVRHCRISGTFAPPAIAGEPLRGKRHRRATRPHGNPWQHAGTLKAGSGWLL